MADDERTSETKETGHGGDTNDISSVSETTEIADSKNAEDVRNSKERISPRRNDAEKRTEKSPGTTKSDEEKSETIRNKSEEVEREITEKKVEQGEKVEVREKQETATAESGHKETSLESSVPVEIDDNSENQLIDTAVVERQPAEKSPDTKISEPKEPTGSENVNGSPVQEYQPLPEYLPDATDNGPESKDDFKHEIVEQKTEVAENDTLAQDIQANRDDAYEVTPQREEVKETVKESPLRLGKSPLRAEKSPYRSGSLGRADGEETPREKRVKLSSGEIRIPNLKAQLNNVIKEIEDRVEETQQEANEEEEEAHEELGEDGQVYHTWKPKGTYELQQTPIVREDVVPMSVDDVQEPLPFEPDPDLEQDGDAQQQAYDQLQSDGSGTITIHPLLPNGIPASPIEIPEGIPLLARILPKEEDSNRERIPLERLFTPATDSGDITPRKKKAFASSDFYAPDHPTIDDQLQLAQKISGSLVDQTNKTSRGQAMYEKRKQRSEKWVHSAQSSETFSVNDSVPKSKPAMKLVMNPKGVQDHTTVEQHYEQLLQESNTTSSGSFPAHIGPSVHIPSSPEIAKDIINDMQSPTGKGAALFAKRKKRMDKFIVDETNVQKSSAYQQQNVVNSSYEQSFASQFSSFSSSSSSAQQQQSAPAPSITAPPGSKKRLQQERDQEQQRIMSEFLNKRESQFQLVKSPWEAALEGNTYSAFKENTSASKITSFSSSSSSAQSGQSSWLEGPKSVPVTAPLPKSGGPSNLPNPPSPFARPPANETKAPATGLVYSAEVKLEQPPKSSLFKQSVGTSPASQAFKAGAQAPAVPTFKPGTVTPAFVPGVSSGNVAPTFAPADPEPAFVPGNPSVSLATGNPALGAQFTPRATIGSGPPSFVDKRKSANFNLAASGWGTYNEYYRPTSFASS